MENKIKNYLGLIVAIPFLLLLIPVSPNSNWINLHNAKKINFFENTAISSIALHADESVPHREIVRVLNIANENKFKLVIATRPVKK